MPEDSRPAGVSSAVGAITGGKVLVGDMAGGGGG